MVAVNDDAVVQAAVADQSKLISLTNDEKKTRLSELLAQGRRDYIAGAYDVAAEKLGEAAELAVAVFGEFAPEAFDPHLYYGRTIMELARANQDVLQNATTGLPSADTSSTEGSNDNSTVEDPNKLSQAEREEIQEKVGEALAELNGAEQKKEETDKDQGKEEEETEEEKEGDESEEDEDGEEADEPSSLQVAWEIARNICDRQEQTREWELKKSDVLLTLAECSIEDENYPQAIEDVTLCLTLQQRHLVASDRRLAHSFFVVARAYKLAEDFGNAAENYQKAADVLKLKLDELEKALETGDESEKAKIEAEVKDLKDLLPDVLFKVEDAKASEGNRQKAKEELKAVFESLVPKANEDAQKEVSDITQLVRKAPKRAADEVPADEAKKSKTDTH